MASITIRNLDEATKQALRERAARNGRSMEEEVRLLLASLEIDPAPSRVSSTQTDLENADFPYLSGKRILLIITAGIAAYKCLDLIRRLRERGAKVRCVMTQSAQEFVTPLSIGAISGDKVFTELWDRDDEHDVGHIRLSREADLVLVAPATADFMAKMAQGHGDDLASCVLLANDKPLFIAPAMNPKMWAHSATQRNAVQLMKDSVNFIGPNAGGNGGKRRSGPRPHGGTDADCCCAQRLFCAATSQTTCRQACGCNFGTYA